MPFTINEQRAWGPSLARDQQGMETIQAVMLLAIAAMVLLGLHALWDDGSGGGIRGNTVAAVDAVFDENSDYGSGGGSGSGGSGGAYDDPSGGSGGSSGGSADSSGGPSASSDGSSDSSDGSSDSSAGSNESGAGAGGDEEESDESGPDDQFADLPALTLNDVRDMASAVVQEANRQKQAAWELERLDAKYAVEGWQQTLAEAQQRGSANQIQAARRGLMEAEGRLLQADEMIKAGDGIVRQITSAVGMTSVVGGLLEAEARGKELTSQGEYREAWRVYVGGATRAMVDGVTTVAKRVPGGPIAALAIGKAAEQAGRELADLTFDPANQLANWLYEQSWWPKNRKPRFNRDGTPRASIRNFRHSLALALSADDSLDICRVFAGS